MNNLGPILSKLISSVPEGYTIIRVKIREDEGFGEAIVESPNGNPQTWYYSDNAEGWV